MQWSWVVSRFQLAITIMVRFTHLEYFDLTFQQFLRGRCVQGPSSPWHRLCRAMIARHMQPVCQHLVDCLAPSVMFFQGEGLIWHTSISPGPVSPFHLSNLVETHWQNLLPVSVLKIPYMLLIDRGAVYSRVSVLVLLPLHLVQSITKITPSQPRAKWVLGSSNNQRIYLPSRFYRAFVEFRKPEAKKAREIHQETAAQCAVYLRPGCFSQKLPGS